MQPILTYCIGPVILNSNKEFTWVRVSFSLSTTSRRQFGLLQTRLRCNLIDNALKHNAGEALQLSVTIRQKSTGFMEFRAADNGKGFGGLAISFFDTGNISSNCGFCLDGVRRLVREREGDILAECSDGCNGADSLKLPSGML